MLQNEKQQVFFVFKNHIIPNMVLFLVYQKTISGLVKKIPGGLFYLMLV